MNKKTICICVILCMMIYGIVWFIVWFFILLGLIRFYLIFNVLYVFSGGTWKLLELYILDFILFFIMPFILTLFILKMPLLFVIYCFLILAPLLLWREHTYLKRKKKSDEAHRLPLGFFIGDEFF